MDFDYSNAYGGTNNTSVISSVGGTLGDTHATPQSLMAASGAIALGASQQRSERTFIVKAPAGKLGVVIDTPGGQNMAPVVHAVKDGSVLSRQVRVGDRLHAVDEVNVQELSAVQVSRLIAQRSNNPVRKLTLVRVSGEAV